MILREARHMALSSSERMAPDDFPVAIVGAGFAGLGMAIQLKKAGLHSFTIFEAADDVGGTWRDNTYPGCACDVPSHMYSFSFAKSSSWSRMYSGQHEIWQYLKHLVTEFGLEPHIRFNTRVVDFHFEEKAGLWHLRTERGEPFVARVVVSGTGPLNKPAFPEILGRETFAGTSFHSSEWNHDYDLTGKQVAVIGTGASAIQIVPQIAPLVGHLSLFQRTPPWIVPKLDFAFPAWIKRLFRWFPPVQWMFRVFLYWQLESRAFGFVTAPKLMKPISKLGLAHIERQIQDPELRKLVTPNYMLGCKRVLLSNEYYPALERENVSLHTKGITEILPHGVRCEDGSEVAVDAIVYSTGFRVYDFLGKMSVTGLEGRDLKETWAKNAKTYYGMAVSGFPNLYFMVGPNTGLGHNSLVFMMEAQYHYILQCIQQIKRRKLRYLDVDPDVQEKQHDALQKRMQDTIWLSGGCRSWYLNEEGKNYSLWPDYTFKYWLKTRHFKARDYRMV